MLTYSAYGKRRALQSRISMRTLSSYNSVNTMQSPLDKVATDDQYFELALQSCKFRRVEFPFWLWFTCEPEIDLRTDLFMLGGQTHQIAPLPTYGGNPTRDAA